MQAKTIRRIKDGAEFDSLFPRANLTEITVKRRAIVSDTVKFIPKVIELTKWQTRKVAERLKAGSEYETCRNIWNFLYQHIRYHKDEMGIEQVRSPARSWHDRFRGIDCDCFTVIACTLLLNCGIDLKRIILRITKYKEDHFQHIYPIILTGNGDYITLDCVVDRFDYEEPYSEKQDTKMDLQYLDGLGEEKTSIKTVDTQDLFGNDEEMGKLFARREKPHKTPIKERIKGILQKGAHITNRINPATVALRNGVLAAMKLNAFKIAQRLKWAYLSETDAKKRGVDLDKWKKLVAVKAKVENVFFSAGGKPENLKSAILTGKGNANREIAGVLGYMPEGTVFEMNERTPVPQLIGQAMWDSENEDSGLGVVAAASVTAASGFLAAISGLLKNIGSIFPKRTKGSEDFDGTEKEDTTAISQGTDSLVPSDGGTTNDNLPVITDDPNQTVMTEQTDQTNKTLSPEENNDTEEETFWDKNKKWLKPTLWVAGSLTGIGLLYGGYKVITRKKTESKQPLSGLKSKKGKKNSKKKTVALM